MEKYIKELIKRKDLVIYLVLSGLKAQHKNSLLGYFWWLLDPFLNVVIYYFIVVIIFRRANGLDYGVFLVIGMIVWRWLHSTVSSASKSILSQSSIITQVYLPKSIFPIGSSITQLINFGFGLVVVALFIYYFNVNQGINLLWLPFIAIMQLFFQMAIALPLAYMCVFIRDIDNIIGHLMRIWFFGSPVIWSAEMIGPRGRWLLEINPMYHFLQCYRDILMHNASPDYLTIYNIGMISIIIVIIMIFFYSRFEHRIIKSL